VGSTGVRLAGRGGNNKGVRTKKQRLRGDAHVLACGRLTSLERPARPAARASAAQAVAAVTVGVRRVDLLPPPAPAMHAAGPARVQRGSERGKKKRERVSVFESGGGGAPSPRPSKRPEAPRGRATQGASQRRREPAAESCMCMLLDLIHKAVCVCTVHIGRRAMAREAERPRTVGS
jgi:hypothetical protein